MNGDTLKLIWKRLTERISHRVRSEDYRITITETSMSDQVIEGQSKPYLIVAKNGTANRQLMTAVWPCGRLAGDAA
jgi:hypothetical protein